jgi:hypothetical protein
VRGSPRSASRYEEGLGGPTPEDQCWGAHRSNAPSERSASPGALQDTDDTRSHQQVPTPPSRPTKSSTPKRRTPRGSQGRSYSAPKRQPVQDGEPSSGSKI